LWGRYKKAPPRPVRHDEILSSLRKESADGPERLKALHRG